MAGDDRVFNALADLTRRLLLDRLFARDGRTLTERETTRFRAMKHRHVVEEAGHVLTSHARPVARKLHSLNAVAIWMFHDRGIDTNAERRHAALADLKAELEKDR